MLNNLVRPLTLFAVIIALIWTLRPALALDVIWGGSRLAFESVRKGKAQYLSLGDVERHLPVSVQRDLESGLFVLSSEANSVPVYRIDPDDYQERDGHEFVRAERIADALGCLLELRKNSAMFDCPRDPRQFRTVGSAEGQTAPGFRYVDGNGVPQDLESRHRQGAAVVAFIRSLDWDPFSQALMGRLQSASDSLSAAGAAAVVIHGYGQKESKAWQDSLKLTLPLIADDASAIMRAYNVHDRGALPHPAVFVVDAAGTIRLRKVFDDLTVPPDLTPVMNTVAGAR